MKEVCCVCCICECVCVCVCVCVCACVCVCIFVSLYFYMSMYLPLDISLPTLQFISTQVDIWEVDTFYLNTISDSNPLVCASYHVFKKRKLFAEFKIPPHKFINFITEIQVWCVKGWLFLHYCRVNVL